MRKTRSDAAFLALEGLETDEQRTIVEWLLTPQLGYKKIAKLVQKEFGIPCNYGALDEFYQSYVAPFLIKKRSLAVTVANQVGEDIQKTPGQFDQVTIDALKQKAFELANNPMSNPKDVKAIFTLVLKAWSEQRKDQELKFDREKFITTTCELILKAARDPKTREVAESNVSNAEKIKAMREKYLAEVDALQASGEIKLPT